MKEINVLIVDDEQYILNALKRLFFDEPFEVYATTDYKEALKFLPNSKVKVVLSDERMAGISGIEFLKNVKEQYPDVIRILFTGYADVKTTEDAINKDEVYKFINKPWNDQDLKVTIKRAIEKFDLYAANKKLTEDVKKHNLELTGLNAKLKNMYELQKEFSSTVSHELRTPLASIKTMLDIVLSGTTGVLALKQKDFLEKAKSNVDRLNRLVNDILSLTKLESGTKVLEMQQNDLNLIIQEVADVQSSVAKNKGLFLDLKLEKDMPKILLNADKINQVLNNLIGNAVKFTEKGGITVSSGINQEKNCIKVCIQDTGYGIKQEDISKLFQKFGQLGDPATRSSGGTGLGLAICREIITQHGGKIWAESEYGRGSSFIFVLPIIERRLNN